LRITLKIYIILFIVYFFLYHKGECWTTGITDINNFNEYGPSNECYTSTWKKVKNPRQPSQKKWHTGAANVNFVYRVTPVGMFFQIITFQKTKSKS